MIRTMLMPKEPTWWIWLGTAQLVSLGLAGVDHAFLTAIFLSVAQTVYFVLKHRSRSALPGQIRVAFTARPRLRRRIQDGGGASAFPPSRFAGQLNSAFHPVSFRCFSAIRQNHVPAD
jgi:hypothetical protein